MLDPIENVRIEHCDHQMHFRLSVDVRSCRQQLPPAVFAALTDGVRMLLDVALAPRSEDVAPEKRETGDA